MGSNFSEIIPGVLFCGNLESGRDKIFLEDEKVKVIINASQVAHERKKEGIVYHFIDVRDWEESNLKQYFEKVYEIVNKAEEEKKVTLVHCQAGISRSTSLCISYLMRRNKWKFEKALKVMKEKRKWTDPNKGFQWIFRTVKKF